MENDLKKLLKKPPPTPFVKPSLKSFKTKKDATELVASFLTNLIYAVRLKLEVVCPRNWEFNLSNFSVHRSKCPFISSFCIVFDLVCNLCFNSKSE